MKRTRPLAPWLRVVIGMTVVATGLPARGEAAPPARTRGAAPASVIPNTFGWQDELIDKLGDVGQQSSIALDSSGHPHIAYYDAINGNLKYAAWDGVAWTVDTVEHGLFSADNFSIFPVTTAIGVFGDTNYIVYQMVNVDLGQSSLRLATGGPGGWTLSAIVTAASPAHVYAPSLRVDSNRALHLSYSRSDAPDQDVIYARLDFTGTAWITHQVDAVPANGLTTIVTSLALDAHNQPQIAYAGSDILSEVPLRWARWSAGNWLTQTVRLTPTIPVTTALLPSLAIDSAGLPGIAYLDTSHFPNQQTSFLNFDGTQWHLATPLVDTADVAPVLAIQYPDYRRIVAKSLGYLTYAQWDGAAWTTQVITDAQGSPDSFALALDAAGNAHISYYDSGYGDLHALTWATNWQTQTVALSGVGTRLAVDIYNRPFVSYVDSGLNLRLANWTPGGDWQYRSVTPNAFYNSLRLQYGVDRQPLPIVSYADETDAANPHLDFAQWNGAAFVTQTVDSAHNVGDWSALAFDSGASPIIGYYDAAKLRVKYAASAGPGDTGWTIQTDTAGPPVHYPWLSIGGSPISATVYIAYVDSVSLTLRLATWDGAHWTDQLVDGGSGDQVTYVSLAVDRTTGEPALAYFDATHGIVKYAVRSGGSWTIVPADSSAANVSDVSLSLALYSTQYPRIAYADSADNSVRLAWTTAPTGTWTVETVGGFGGLSSADVSSQAQTRDFLALDQAAGKVVYAFHSATLPYSIYFNPLQPCVEPAPPPMASLGHTLAYVRALAPSNLEQVDDLTTLRALRDLFALSPGGRSYIELYYQHSQETGALALHDPALLWDGYRTLQNFLPGFLALETGQGSRQVISQAMVDQVNHIADRLVAAGSPSLGAAINTERAKYNHLQAFVGQTFDSGAKLLGVASHAIYLPVTQR